MATELEFVDRDRCQSKHGSNNITSSMVCAGGYGDTCEGDSGGPLTCSSSQDLRNGRQQSYLCGILSWGYDCKLESNNDYPDVYTDVTMYEEWIQRRWCKITIPHYVLNANITLKNWC